MYSFEDKIQEIDREIAKRKSKWQLKAVAWMDFKDVAQIVRIHIHNKWDLWDQNRDFLPWVNTVITHRITNLLRDLYMNIARPCVSCPANEGGDHSQGEGYCRIYTKQCNACPLYAAWEKSKKHAHDIKLPVSIENHTQDIYSIPEEHVDIQGKAAALHIRMKEVLSPIQFKIYKYLYIDGKPEEEVAKLMGYKTSEKNRSPGYKQLKNMQKVIITKAKKIVNTELY